jgi:hypothetical protein
MVSRIFYSAFFLVLLSGGSALAQSICDSCKELDMERQELALVYKLYRDAVNTARSNGYQCGSDPNYMDYGPGMARVGNCADWAFVSWEPLAARTWRCWKIVKVRARKQFWFWHHNFVYVEPRCGGGPRVYLDPWGTGRPDVFIGDQFPCSSGFLGWIHYPLETHYPRP